MASPRLLLVDDDESVRVGLKSVLEAHEFEVTAAANVVEALQRIMSERFDVLLSDLHMPGAGDGLTVVSAMRHANPDAVTIVLSAFPDMQKATAAILAQTDEVILKPVKAGSVVELIRQRMAEERPAKGTRPATQVSSVASVLEQETEAITQRWLALMATGSAASGGLTAEERCDHLPFALRDIIFRLRYPQPMGATTVFSMAALQHGARRRRQGIGVATLAEEARALQAALFETIEASQGRIYLGRLPSTLMTIADEVNAQLQQCLLGYENEQPVDVPTTWR